MSLKRGSMWNTDLVSPEYDAFGNLMSREYVEGVEFSHFNIYPKGQSKCLMISLRDMNKFCWQHKLLRRWIDNY